VPRYFFSVRYRERVLPDRDGVELGSDVDLRSCASYLARRLQAEGGITELQFPGCVVEVADAGGKVLLSVPLPPA
jgi:hypothetical protein